MLFLNKSKLETSIDDNTEIVSMEAEYNIYRILGIKTRLNLLRTTFIDQETRSYIVAFKLLNNSINSDF